MLIKGSFISTASGKAGGIVARHNKGGLYLAAFQPPTNPDTPEQQVVRARFGGDSAAFRALTLAQQQTWVNFGEASPRVNALGDPRPISGVNAFISVNNNIVNAGGASILIAPALVGADQIESIAVTATTGPDDVEIAFTPDPVPADHTLIIQATIPLSTGIVNVNNRYRQIAIEVTTTGSPVDLTAEYTAKYGSLITGQNLHVRVYHIRTDSGEVSVARTAFTTIA